MKIFVLKFNRNYYCLGAENSINIFDDLGIMCELDIESDEYKVIIISCNGIIEDMNNIYFEKRKDAEKAIKALEPYLVIATLMEE